MKLSNISGRMRRKTFAAIGLLTVAAASLLSGCGNGDGSPNAINAGNITDNGSRFASSYAGNWSGNWVDISGTSGTATMVITIDTTTKITTVTISLSGNQFGFAGSQSTLTGTYDSTGIHVFGPSGQSAAASLVIDPTGLFTGTATNISPTVTSVTYGGPSTSQSATLQVTVHHTDGTTESGTITVTKNLT